MLRTAVHDLLALGVELRDFELTFNIAAETPDHPVSDEERADLRRTLMRLAEISGRLELTQSSLLLTAATFPAQAKHCRFLET